MTAANDGKSRDATLLSLFKQEARAGAEKLVAGLETLDSAADPSGVMGELLRVAHSVKGAARIVELDVVARLCAGIESCLKRAAADGTLPAAPLVELAKEAAGWLGRFGEASADVDEVERVNAGALAVLLNAVEQQAAGGKPAHVVVAARVSTRPPVDATLVELFRIEVEQCTSALSNGLIGLEQDPTADGKWEMLLRAAHSIKGAARIVGLVSFEQLAHAFEDALLAARETPDALAAERVDALLDAIDALQATGRALDASGSGIAVLENRCLAVANRLRRPVEQVATPKATPPTSPPPLAHEPKRHISVVAPANSTRARTGDKPERTPKPLASEPALERKDSRVLRVAAQSIDRLMGFAGESLVESRRIANFGKVVERVRKRQAALLEVVRSLDLASSDGDDRSRLLSDAKARAQECVELFAGHAAELESYTRRAEELSERLYREALKSRMRPFSDGTHAFPRVVRDLARQLGKLVEFEIVGAQTEVDRDVLESLEAPLNHLLRNALDHGLEQPQDRARAGKAEKAKVRLEARHHAGLLVITVSDDGRGIDADRIREKAIARGLVPSSVASNLSRAELLEFLFLPGFTTATVVTEVSGRGIGLDVVRSAIEAASGTVRVTSELGVGTSFHLQLPVTRSVARALVTDIAGESYAFPLLRIERVLRLSREHLRTLEGRQYFVLDDLNVALVHARQLLGCEGQRADDGVLSIVVIGEKSQRFGIVVDGFSGEHDLVVRPLDSRLGKVQDIAAAAVLGDGSPALIVDVDDLLRSIDRAVRSDSLPALETTASEPAARKRILVVDDSITVREAERQLLVNRGYDVDIAVDGIDALNAIRRTGYDLVVTDVDMPRLNGIELVKTLKQDGSLKGIPVVIVSYKDRGEDRMRGLEAGANYYLTKTSFHDEKLVQAVEDLIGAAA